MNQSFLNREKPWLTLLFSAETEKRAMEIVAKGINDGAEAFCIQTEALRPEDRTPETYRRIFEATGNRPIYVTNYRKHSNEGVSDGRIAQELLTLADCGAALCDVMGDLYCPTPGEMTDCPEAIQKQRELIERLHEKGTEVIMSSHVLAFTPAERVVEMALDQQERGADIVKIVTGAQTMEEQLENLRITHLLKRELRAPFLFLSGGMCELHRRVGPMLGCCMYLCSLEDDLDPKPVQPMLRKTKAIWENWG